MYFWSIYLEVKGSIQTGQFSTTSRNPHNYTLQHVLLTSLDPSQSHLHTHISPHSYTSHCASYPSHYVSCSTHPAHLVRSQSCLTCTHTSCPMHTPFTCVSSHLHISLPHVFCHLIRTWLCLSQHIGLSPVCAAHAHYISVGSHHCVSVDGVWARWPEVGRCTMEAVTSGDVTRTDWVYRLLYYYSVFIILLRACSVPQNS